MDGKINPLTVPNKSCLVGLAATEGLYSHGSVLYTVA